MTSLCMDSGGGEARGRRAGNQEWFIKRGIYVILQRAKIICCPRGLPLLGCIAAISVSRVTAYLEADVLKQGVPELTVFLKFPPTV